MANEIVTQNLGTGFDGYFQVRLADLTVYNGTAFEAFNAPDWASQYARGQAAADAAGDYKANFPALSAGYYYYKVFACANGGTPETTDSLVEYGGFYWDGTQRIDRLSGVVVNSLLANVITSTAFQDGALTSAKFADGFLTAAKIAAGAITNAKFAAGAIDTAAIADAALTAAKIVALPTAERTAIAAAVGVLVVEAAAGVAPAFDLIAVLKQLLAYAVGPTTGMATVTGNIKNPGNTKTRATATLDGNGNRTPTAWDNT